MDEDTQRQETGGRKDLALAVGLTILATLAGLAALVIPVELIATAPLIAIRALFVLPLVFLLPGYALLQAIWPIRPLEWAERALMSIGLSLTVAILGGLALNFTPWGLQTTTWTALLAGFTLLCCGIAAMRRVLDHTYVIPLLDASTKVPHRISFAQGIMIALSSLLVVAAVSVSVISATQAAATGYTQLWLTPPAQGAQVTSLQVGVRNMETDTLTYYLELQLNGTVVQTFPAFTLAPQQELQTNLAVPSTVRAESELLEVLLYRVDQPDAAYRHVSLWLAPTVEQATSSPTQAAAAKKR